MTIFDCCQRRKDMTPVLLVLVLMLVLVLVLVLVVALVAPVERGVLDGAV